MLEVKGLKKNVESMNSANSFFLSVITHIVDFKVKIEKSRGDVSNANAAEERSCIGVQNFVL